MEGLAVLVIFIVVATPIFDLMAKRSGPRRMNHAVERSGESTFTLRPGAHPVVAVAATSAAGSLSRSRS